MARAKPFCTMRGGGGRGGGGRIPYVAFNEVFVTASSLKPSVLITSWFSKLGFRFVFSLLPSKEGFRFRVVIFRVIGLRTLS